MQSWQGVFAPAGMPKLVVERLGREIAAIVALPAVQDTLIKQIDSIWFQGNSVDKALAEADRQVDTVLAQ